MERIVSPIGPGQSRERLLSKPEGIVLDERRDVLFVADTGTTGSFGSKG